jgi:hypothetical protein
MKMLLSAAAVAAVAGTSSAQLIAYDSFDYADGSLVGNGNWANHSGNAGDLLVSGGQAIVQHGTPSEDANTAFASTAGDIFFGIDFTVTSSGQISGGDNEYFAHFHTVGTFDFRGRLDVVAAPGGGDFSVGISSSTSTAEATWASDLVFGQTYRAVVGYDQIAGVAQLWIDAALSSDTSISGLATGSGIMDTFSLRQSDSAENETVAVDNLTIGGTFEDVVIFTPAPASAALLGLGGIAALRRRR